MPHPQIPHTFELDSISKKSHTRVGSKKQRLGARLIKMLLNLHSFELGLMVVAKRMFLSVTPPNDFCLSFFDKSVSFVDSDTLGPFCPLRELF